MAAGAARHAGLVRVALALAPLVLLGCVAQIAPPAGPWQTALGRAHPLVGRVWDVGGAAFVEPGALVTALARPRFVLLGEKHDNPDHHRLQAWVVEALIAGGRRPAVAFEMLTSDQAPAIAGYVATAPADAGGLGEAVGWKRSGWPDWAMYRPIAAAALRAGLPIVPANLPPAVIRVLRERGPAALDPRLVARHRLDQPPPPAVGEAMATEIREAHCGHAREEIIPAMVLVQRARDARMAEALLEIGGEGAVLIAGAGHVRKDRGVPAYLDAAGAGGVTASLAFVEVADGATAASDHAARFGATALPFDYVWFTPRLEDTDPCEKFRRALEELRERK